MYLKKENGVVVPAKAGIQFFLKANLGPRQKHSGATG